MSPPERLPPDDPREWLNRARSNLVRARRGEAGVYLEDLCFDAQQAAEKAVKAVLVAHKVDFPYVHDLAHLLSLFEGTGAVVPEAVRQAEELTPYRPLGGKRWDDDPRRRPDRRPDARQMLPAGWERMRACDLSLPRTALRLGADHKCSICRQVSVIHSCKSP